MLYNVGRFKTAWLGNGLRSRGVCPGKEALIK